MRTAWVRRLAPCLLVLCGGGHIAIAAPSPTPRAQATDGGGGCKYFALGTGVASCADDTSTGAAGVSLLDPDACAAAAASLVASPSFTATVENLRNWPTGCYAYALNRGKLFMNTDDRAFETCTKTGVQCLCGTAACVPPTLAPSTLEPTVAPPTRAPATEVPLTPAPPTDVPSTPTPATPVPTPVPTTAAPPTAAPPTTVPATPRPPPPPTTIPVPPTGVPTPPMAAATASPGSRSPRGGTDVAGTEEDAALRNELEQQERAGRAAAAAASVGALVGGAAAAGVGMRMLTSGAACGVQYSDEARYYLAISPLQLRVNDSRAVGAVVGNLAICAVAGLLAYLAAAILGFILPQFKKTRGIDPFGLLCFPATPLAVVAVLYHGTILAAGDVAFSAASPTDVGISVSVLVGAIAYPVVLHRCVVGVGGKQRIPGLAFVHPLVTHQRWIWTVVYGKDVWVSRKRRPHYSARWASVIYPFKVNGLWFVVADLAASFLTAMLNAHPATSYTSCGHQKLATGVVFVAVLTAIAFGAPHLAPHNHYCDACATGLQAAAMFALAAGYYSGDSGHRGFEVGSMLLFIATGMLYLRISLEVLGVVHTACTKRRDIAQAVVWGACEDPSTDYDSDAGLHKNKRGVGGGAVDRDRRSSGMALSDKQSGFTALDFIDDEDVHGSRYKRLSSLLSPPSRLLTGDVRDRDRECGGSSNSALHWTAVLSTPSPAATPADGASPPHTSLDDSVHSVRSESSLRLFSRRSVSVSSASPVAAPAGDDPAVPTTLDLRRTTSEPNNPFTPRLSGSMLYPPRRRVQSRLTVDVPAAAHGLESPGGGSSSAGRGVIHQTSSMPESASPVRSVHSRGRSAWAGMPRGRGADTGGGSSTATPLQATDSTAMLSDGEGAGGSGNGSGLTVRRVESPTSAGVDWPDPASSASPFGRWRRRTTINLDSVASPGAFGRGRHGSVGGSISSPIPRQASVPPQSLKSLAGRPPLRTVTSLPNVHRSPSASALAVQYI